jgi:large subunit ribosomal protein L9
MKVILRQNISTLGRIGDIITVKDGFARNYLIPRSIAYFASIKAIKALEVEKVLYEKRQAREKAVAEQLAVEFADLQISLSMKVGEEGKLYGSVTNILIASALNAKGYNIDKRSILIEEPIKTLGIFDVKVKLHQDVTAPLKVWVIGEE